MNLRPRSLGDDRAQSTVELAILLPVLLLLVIGIVDVAVGINAYVTVTDASREGAAYAVRHPTAAPSAIVSAATSRSAPLANITVTTSYYSYAAGAFVSSPWPPPSGSPAPTSLPIRVDVSYPWSATSILIGRFFGSSPVRFHGTSTMVATW